MDLPPPLSGDVVAPTPAPPVVAEFGPVAVPGPDFGAVPPVMMDMPYSLRLLLLSLKFYLDNFVLFGLKPLLLFWFTDTTEFYFFARMC